MRIYYDRKKWSIMSVAIECSDFYKDSNQNVCKKSKSSLFKIDTEKVSAVATYFFKFLVVLQFVLSTGRFWSPQFAYYMDRCRYCAGGRSVYCRRDLLLSPEG